MDQDDYSQKKVVLKGYIIVPDEDLPAVREELVNHKRLTRAEAGCLIFKVTQNENNPNRFDVYEEFADREAFEQHQRRAKRSRWAEVSANVKRHYEILESVEKWSER